MFPGYQAEPLWKGLPKRIPFDGINVQDVLDSARPIASYTALRAYTGRATSVRITAARVAGFFYRDDSDTTTADDSGTVIVDAKNRRWKRLFDGAASVQWFGAVGDKVTDDTAALNLAFAWLRSYAVTDPPLMRPIRLTGHNGIYRCDGSVNASGINLGRAWELDGLNIWSHAVGKTALDLVGLRWGHLSNVRVWGDQTDQPHTGILLARNASTCSDNLFHNVSTDGYFTQAGLLVYAAEVNRFDHCHIWNRRVPDGGGEAWAAILQGTDYKAMVSDFQVLSTGRQSFTVNQFDQCMIQKPFGIAGPTMFMQDMASVSFNSCYVTNGGGSGIEWRLTSGFTPYRVYMDFQQETTGTDRFIQFTSDAAAAREIRGLECTFGNVYCDSEIFASDTLTGLTLNSFKCHLYRMATGVTLANKLFAAATAALTTLRDVDIVVPTAADFNGPGAFAGITGTVTSLDGGYTEYSGIARVLGQSAASVSHTGSVAETTLATITVPAGAMGRNGRLRITTNWTVTNSVNGKGLRIRFGGQLVNTQPTISAATARYQTEIANRNATNSQLCPSTSNKAFDSVASAVTTLAVDTTAAVDIQIQCLLANAADTATLESYVVEIMRGE